jgi:hypothetical protein
LPITIRVGAMFNNRIAEYLDRYPEPVNSGLAVSQYATSTSNGASGMIYLPVVAPLANWQAYLYQMAYQRAVADLAPPRHHRRFFSVWN